MTSAIDIRAATPADAWAILAMNERVAAEAPFFLAYEMDPATGADVLQAKLGLGQGGDAVLIAADGAEVIGAALLRRHLHPAFFGVLQLAVSIDPNWRGKGVGKALVAAAIDWARQEGARRV
ncbi:MAG: N-acetyltransferase family protein [Alphaproteobacteria bacterium]